MYRGDGGSRRTRRHTHTHRERERDTERGTQRNTERHGERHREAERHRHTGALLWATILGLSFPPNVHLCQASCLPLPETKPPCPFEMYSSHRSPNSGPTSGYTPSRRCELHLPSCATVSEFLCPRLPAYLLTCLKLSAVVAKETLRCTTSPQAQRNGGPLR